MSQPIGESGRKHTRFPPRPGTNCALLTHEALAPLLLFLLSSSSSTSSRPLFSPMLPLPSFLIIPLFSLLLLSLPFVTALFLLLHPALHSYPSLKKNSRRFPKVGSKHSPSRGSPARTDARRVDFPRQNTRGRHPCRNGVSCRIFTLLSGLGFRGGATALAAKVARWQEAGGGAGRGQREEWETGGEAGGRIGGRRDTGWGKGRCRKQPCRMRQEAAGRQKEVEEGTDYKRRH